MISSATPNPVYVLAFDYRGFGSSTGTPNEGTRTQDAIDVIRWVIEVLNIPADRIILVAQSLGTALACAAANHFIDKEPKVEFAGISLCAPFTDAASMFLDYSIGGYFSLLAPLRQSNTLITWFARQMTDTWKSTDRIAKVFRKSSRLRITFVHATSDSVNLAANVLEDEDLSPQAINERRRRKLDSLIGQRTEIGAGSHCKAWRYVRSYPQSGIILILR